MAFTIPLNPPSAEEIHLDELAQKVDGFRLITAAMADDFSISLPRLRDEGTPLPTSWKRQYIDWTDQRSQMATEISSALGVPSISSQGFSDWVRLINDQRDGLRAVREIDAESVNSVAEMFERIQGLHSDDPALHNSPELQQIRQLGKSSLQRLSDPASRSEVVNDAAMQQALDAVLALADDRSDGEEEESQYTLVESMFGRKLAIALLRRRITAPPFEATSEPEMQPESVPEGDLESDFQLTPNA